MNMANDYSILANYIVTKYIDTISGNDISDTFVDDSPASRVMVGKLAENRMEQSFEGGYTENAGKKFESVPSLTITFVVKKNNDGILRIVPRGLLFYSVKPDYEKTKQFIIQKYSEKDKVEYKSIDELCDCYPEEKFFLPQTYRKVQIEKELNDGIEIHLNGIKEKTFHLEQQIGQKLEALANQIFDEVYIMQRNKISFFDLSDESRFNLVSGRKEERVVPRWGIDVYCTVTNELDNYRFTLQMVNKTPVDGNRNIGYLPQIFNAGMNVVGNDSIKFVEIELDYFKNTYKEKPLVYVVAENTSASYDADNNMIYTDNIPKYYQMRLKTKDNLNQYITFDNLILDPIGMLRTILREMKLDYSACEKEFNNTSFSSEGVRRSFSESLDDYRNEINRFENGIDQIEYKDNVKKAFIYMNRTFKHKLYEGEKTIVGWRLFQIVFIVSLIPEMIRSEYKNDSTLADSTKIAIANMLYFPTGGGKTEAFLGAGVFDMFFDRLRGKEHGVSVLIKYPLRLLAVQQLDRVLKVVIKANSIRTSVEELANCNPFEVGFFVGSNNTPNKIDAREKLSNRGNSNASSEIIIESDQDTLNDYYRFIDTCPCCNQKSINVRFNKESWKLEHICDNSSCKINVLPIMIVDSEIYRYLPSVVVSTVDKMAMLGTTNDFKMLFGQVISQCPNHGFSVTNRCSCPECNASMKATGLLKDPIPTLIIQDEMHLIKESLGTFDAHYESFIDYYAKNLVPENQKKQIRFVGATATISMYDVHIWNLYHMPSRRFPCEYPSAHIGEDFYSYTDNNDVTRIILGYAPYGRTSITDGMWESVYTMRCVVYDLFRNLSSSYETMQNLGFSGNIDDYKEMLYDYWIDLVYNNRKQDAIELENAFQNQANNLLETKGCPKFSIEQMTSDVDFQTVRKTLFDIQANRRNLESTNLLLATSTISHGVDEDSFNVMYFFGMPNNNAEYIQAYSRTGRKHTGIVIDIIRLMRPRDRSYLKNFIIFHQNKDDLVESVPINRWAKNAIYSTLPGILSGLLMQYYTVHTGTESFYRVHKLKKLLSDEVISIEDVSEKMIGIYGCNSQEKLSLAYQEVIADEVKNILNGIKNGNFNTSDSLSDAISKFSHNKKIPMRSLRDTEEQITIKI